MATIEYPSNIEHASTPKSDTSLVSGVPESYITSISVRPASESDMPRLAEVDIESFKRLYSELGPIDKSLYDKKIELYKRRFGIVGPDWITVAEDNNGEIQGLLLSCPTNKAPDEFISWEETTDNGTLETTYDPDGRFAYVVTLSALSAVSKFNAPDSMYIYQLGNLVRDGMGSAYFESRMPGFRTWMRAQTKKTGQTVQEISRDELHDYALTYVDLTKVVNGKEVRKDKLLRLYDDFGANFVRVVPDAYIDPQSLNYGVVCEISNPLPHRTRDSKIARTIGEKSLKYIANKPKLMERIL